jgi:class 3 adenylate cyclase
LDSIRQIGRALASSTFDTRKVLSYTMDMIRMLINAEGGALFQVEGDEIVSAALFNIDLGELEAIRLRMGQGVAGTVAARGEPLIVNDPDHSPHFHPQIDWDTGFQTRSILCVPMISQGKVIGVIEVLNKLSGDFTLKDRDLLVSIAASVSIAVENARLYKETVAMAEHERGIRGVFQKFVPRQILDQILHGAEGGQTGLNELKTLTLLNIDIRKSSDFVRRVGPQKTVALLNHFFSVMGEIVFARHGVVDKYLGDGFLAIFGAPVSSTRDAENAVIAALEMKNAMARVNDHCREAFGETVTMGISVHTGEMVVGNIGFEMKMDYTVIGDPVNIVFRLQERTRPYPDGILVTENVHRAALSRLEVEPAPEPLAGLRVLELKGRRGGG